MKALLLLFIPFLFISCAQTGYLDSYRMFDNEAKYSTTPSGGTHKAKLGQTIVRLGYLKKVLEATSTKTLNERFAGKTYNYSIGTTHEVELIGTRNKTTYYCLFEKRSELGIGHGVMIDTSGRIETLLHYYVSESDGKKEIETFRPNDMVKVMPVFEGQYFSIEEKEELDIDYPSTKLIYSGIKEGKVTFQLLKFFGLFGVETLFPAESYEIHANPKVDPILEFEWGKIEILKYDQSNIEYKIL